MPLDTAAEQKTYRWEDPWTSPRGFPKTSG